MLKTTQTSIIPEFEYLEKLWPLVPWAQLVDEHSYVMEKLEHRNTPDILCKSYEALQLFIWNQPATLDPNWVEEFEARFHFSPPDWVCAETPCLIHGDPTVGNTMFRSSDRVVLIDPKPPGKGIPSFRTVDIGKMLQSYLGWEFLLVSQPLIEYDVPEMDELTVNRSWFWCRIHFLRILQRETPGSIIHQAVTDLLGHWNEIRLGSRWNARSDAGSKL